MRHIPICLAVSLMAALSAPLHAQTPEQVAEAALKAAPIWDGHNDVPIQLRGRFSDVIENFDFRDTSKTGDNQTNEDFKGRAMHTDLARLRKGRVGAQFWSVFVSAELPKPPA